MACLLKHPRLDYVAGQKVVWNAELPALPTWRPAIIALNHGRREATAKGNSLPASAGLQQGGVVSPLLSNILLTPFDHEMRRKGYQLTRFADDWVITCKSEARAALAAATRILEQLVRD
jgi:hypothetical protein